MNRKLWQEIVIKGEENQSDPLVNILNINDRNTILASMEFFGATDIFMRQTAHDLTIPKFRVFDWLAMNIMGRNDDDREINNISLKMMVHSFIVSGYDEKRFIADLRETDYDIIRDWENIQIEGD